MRTAAALLLLLFTGVLQGQTLKDLHWLAGEWVNFNEKDSTYEVWKIIEDEALDGYGLTISGGDTVFFEQLQIIEINDTVYYKARIEDQNDGAPVLFRYFYKDHQHIFFNRQHDFPQKIIYSQSGDTLNITLEGVEDYYEKKIDLVFYRASR